MDIRNHYALQRGSAPFPDGRIVQLTVVDLGELRVDSGLLGASDPFVNLYDPVVVPINPGTYPVRATIADVSEAQDGSHMREAYLSIVLSDAESTSVEPAPNRNGPPPSDEYWVVGVDAGTVSFVDADAVSRCMPSDEDDWYDEVFDTDEPDSWFTQMDNDAPQPAGTANIVMPLATKGENLVLSHSGWGDGAYPLTQTRAADGTVTGIHIDLLVVGEPEEEEESVVEHQEPNPPKRGFARLFGRR